MSYNTFPALQGLGWPIKVTPQFKTIVQQAASGAEYRTALWQNPLHLIEVPINFLTQADWRTLVGFFKQQQGSFLPFYFTPTQTPWAASAIPFGTWNGSATSAGLVDPAGNPISSATVSAIHRTDWQGRQLLYPTPRTNESLSSQCSTTVWFTGNAIWSTAAPLTPSGTGAAYLLLAGTTSGQQICKLHDNGFTANNSIGCFFDVAPAGYNYCQAAIQLKTGGINGGIFDLVSGVFTTQPSTYGGAPATNLVASSIPLPNGYYRVILQATLTTPQALSNVSVCSIFNNSQQQTFAGDGVSGLYLANGQEWADGPLGVLINTSGSPATLTDYTLAGTTVNLAQAPAATATTDWDGIGSNAETYLVRFPDGIQFEQFMSQLFRTKTLKLQEVR